MRGSLRCGDALDARAFAALRRAMIFGCGKWDPQNEAGEALACYPIVMEGDEWRRLARLAERLAHEMLAAEREIASRPELLRGLALPRRLRRALARAAAHPRFERGPRFTRFDFHPTPDGWRISEANADVPGGFLESFGLARLAQAHVVSAHPPGDPTQALVDGLARATSPAAEVALVHATAYVDDRQVMLHLGRHLEGRGLRAHLVSPEQLDWSGPRPWMRTSWREGPIDAVLRFFPAEWLANLPRSSGWTAAASHACPQSNPLSALLVQGKRFPLVWDRLRTPLPTWRALLPETRDPRDAPWTRDGSWVVKPALGRVGNGVGIRGVTGERAWRAIARSARLVPGQWVAQRRFAAVPIDTPDGGRFPSFGVFVVAGRAAGCYARLAPQPLIDARAQDVALLVAPTRAIGAEAAPHVLAARGRA